MGQVLLPAVKALSQSYTCKADLWQIGHLVLTLSSAGGAA